MGVSYSASMKRKQQGFRSDHKAALLLKRIRELQNEMLVEREKQRQLYERMMQESEAEWRKERRELKEQVRTLSRHLEVATSKKLVSSSADEPNELRELGVSEIRQNHDDYTTAERWKKLYNVVKAELDDLIQKTQNSG